MRSSYFRGIGFVFTLALLVSASSAANAEQCRPVSGPTLDGGSCTVNCTGPSASVTVQGVGVPGAVGAELGIFLQCPLNELFCGATTGPTCGAQFFGSLSGECTCRAVGVVVTDALCQC